MTSNTMPSTASTSPKVPATTASDAKPATASATDAPPSSASATAKAAMKRTFSQKNRETGVKFLSAYAKTWIGMSPVYLMAEAVTPGKKVGTGFKAGWSDLSKAVDELQDAVTSSSKDILIIVDQQLRTAGDETNKTAELIKAAGEHAVVVVSTSVAKAQEQIHRTSPSMKKAVVKNGKDCVVLVDKALKNPIVITGITKFAQTKGIPNAAAVLQVASMGLAKIIATLDDANLDGGIDVEELDAGDLERTSTREVEAEAERIGRAGTGPRPQIQSGSTTTEPAKQESGCTIS